MNMKKILSIFLCILILISLSSCSILHKENKNVQATTAPSSTDTPKNTEAPTNTKTPESTNTPEKAEPTEKPDNIGLTNPSVEYSSLNEINDILCCKLTKPGVMGVSNEHYAIISTGDDFDIAEFTFTLNSLSYNFRFCGSYDDDISGVYTDGNTTFSGMVNSLEYAKTSDLKLARWATIDGQYCLCVRDNGQMEQSTFENIVDELKYFTEPINDNSISNYYSSLAGEYFDSYSGRASATVVQNGNESVTITVKWASSAFEVYQWVMNATVSTDGLLYYTDCVNSIITCDDNNNESVEILYTDGEGFFGESDSVLYWNGASEENCQNCVFQKLS